MNCTAEMLRLYAVTDRAWVGKLTLPQQVEAALKGGATCVQLREKNLADSSILAEAREISALCKQYRVPFILNDNVALAAQCGADGVHLGQEDMDPAEARRILGPDAIIGVSAHNVAEAKAAVAAGADYLGCGAMGHLRRRPRAGRRHRRHQQTEPALPRPLRRSGRCVGQRHLRGGGY